MHWAAYEDGGGGEVAALLLTAGADVNAQAGDEEQTPLHLAAEEEKADVVSALLLDEDILVNLEDENGQTALDLAVEERADDLAATLRESGGVCLDNGHSNRRAHLCGLRFWPRSAEVVLPVGYAGDIYTIAVATNTEQGGGRRRLRRFRRRR